MIGPFKKDGITPVSASQARRIAKRALDRHKRSGHDAATAQNSRFGSG
jgi:hypothetical protein